MNNTNTIVAHQGDVLIMRVSVNEDEFKQRAGKPMERNERGLLVLAEGEVTGHLHAVREVEVQGFAWIEGTRLLRSPKPFEITHDEHAPISLPPGDYIVAIQREYNPQRSDFVFD